jgi:hypothetical protein
MDAATGTLLGTVLGASITLIGTSLQAWNGRKTAQITAENAATMQSDKLRHDAFLGEIAFKRGKLEELYQAVARATAYSTLSVAVLRSDVAPTPNQILERYDEDMTNILRARMIAELYFNSLTETINKLTGFIDHSLFTHRQYFRNEPNQEPDYLSRWTGEIVKLGRELAELRPELNQKIAQEASQLSVMETDVSDG